MEEYTILLQQFTSYKIQAESYFAIVNNKLIIWKIRDVPV